MTAVTNQLPPAFEDLEPWADWALPTEPERYAKRLASEFDELQAFYDAAFPRLEEAAAAKEAQLSNRRRSAVNGKPSTVNG